MNQLSMVNKILRRLREDEVASVADNAYSQLIAELINEGLEEVQAAFMWSSLDTTVEFDTILDTRDYDLTAETTDRTILRMANSRRRCTSLTTVTRRAWFW
jgi:hypothetical protein